MTRAPSQGPVIQVKPQPNVYTVLLIVAVLFMAVTVGRVMYNLMSPVSRPDGLAGGYGLSFSELFKPLTDLIPGQ